jgi:MFS family permease
VFKIILPLLASNSNKASFTKQAAVFNFSGFFAIRFFLGLLEAVISPAFIMLTSMLWTREEQSLRTSFWLSVNGISSILGALLAYGAGHASGLAIPQWKLIYLVR